ncbi:hypothetical protein A3734_03425 [Sulfitobacter sp. HI0054]|nr:hypothetical protein A3734_03425 [Sulfitobacter sp. HI0054]
MAVAARDNMHKRSFGTVWRNRAILIDQILYWHLCASNDHVLGNRSGNRITGVGHHKEGHHVQHGRCIHSAPHLFKKCLLVSTGRPAVGRDGTKNDDLIGEAFQVQRFSVRAEQIQRRKFVDVNGSESRFFLCHHLVKTVARMICCRVAL